MAGGKGILGGHFIQQQRLYRAVQQLISLQVALCIHFALQTQANIGQSFVETLDDMKHIDADVSLGKNLAGNRNKAVVHVTAEVFHSLPLSRRKLPEVGFDIVSADLRKNIHDIALVTIAVDDVAVISVAMPAFLLIIPFTGIALELIDANGFGQVLGSIKGNAVEHMLHNGDGDVQHRSDTPKRRGVHQGFAKFVIQGEVHAKRWMDPIRVLHESGFACFAEQPPLVEGHHRGAVMSRSMTEGLQIAGIFDVALIGTTVWTESMQKWITDNQVFVIVVMGNDFRDPNAGRQVRESVEFFHSVVVGCHWIVLLEIFIGFPRPAISITWRSQWQYPMVAKSNRVELFE